MYTVAVTGHRPPKLWGYDLSDPHYEHLQKIFEQHLLNVHCTDAWTGMALGADTIFARAVLELRARCVDIKLHCAIPCLNHSSRWTRESQQEYDRILSVADEVSLVTRQPYAPQLMQIRNQYMVDHADEVLALWDGTSGGTGNCVQYAKSKHVPVTIIKPSEI